MRKRRAIIIGSDPDTAGKLGTFFEARGYETAVFRGPAICPVSRKNEQCPGPPGCGDIAVVRHELPALNAVGLLAAQQRGGCGLAAANKAVVASSLDAGELDQLAGLGAPLFMLPLDLGALETWVAERETRMDLSRPVAIRRREERVAAGAEQLALLLGAEVEQTALVNKSDCGVCFRTSRRLVRNQVLKVRSFPHGLTEDAVVRWIRQADSGSYLVGLSYCA
ncbi:MAG: hypothetical protein ACYC7L_17570 [Nitrospirota bacterium]